MVDPRVNEIYKPFNGSLFAGVPALTRARAKRRFEELINLRGERIQQLASLVKRNGWELAGSDAGIQSLNEWYYDSLQPDFSDPGRMTDTWISVTHDIALFLGEQMILRWPNLHWELYRWGKTSVEFNQHVIMGLNSPNPKMNIDLDRMAVAYGNRVASRRNPPQYESVIVRGVVVDVGEIAKRHDAVVPRNEFLRWMNVARGYSELPREQPGDVR